MTKNLTILYISFHKNRCLFLYRIKSILYNFFLNPYIGSARKETKVIISNNIIINPPIPIREYITI